MRDEVRRLLDSEDLRPDLRRALVRGTASHVRLNGNVLEVELGVDAALATASDLLDASVQITFPLSELAAYPG